MSNANLKISQKALLLLSLAAISFPIMLVFLFPPKYGFYDNWYENLWVFGYFGEYFRRHFSFPVFLNATNGSIGLPLPIFYGFTLYPIMGLLSSLLGSNLATKFSLIALFAAQFLASYLLIKKITKDKFISFVTSCLLIWAIYPLTNIYNRGALPEVFSTGFFTLAVIFWFYLLLVERLKIKLIVGILFAFSLSEAIGSWPPAFIQGVLILGFLLTVTIPVIWKNIRDHKYTLLVFFFAFLYTFIVVLPWVKVSLQYAKNFWVAGPKIDYYPGMDSFWVRFSPFPLDLRTVSKGLDVAEKTPYLEAQVNMPLLLFVIVLLFILLKNLKAYRRKILITVPFIILFIYYSLLSVSPGFAATLPKILTTIHFHYRFVTYQNLTVLISVIVFLLLIKQTNYLEKIRNSIYISLALLLGLAFQSVLIKNLHGRSIFPLVSYPNTTESFGVKSDNRDTIINTSGVPGYFFGYRDIKTFKEPPAEIANDIEARILFPVSGGREFGKQDNVAQVNLPRDANVYFNMNPFVWNHLMVDEKEVPAEKIYLSGWSGIVVTMSRGSHQVRIDSRPDTLWLILRNISYFLLISGFIASSILSIIFIKNQLFGKRNIFEFLKR